MKTKLILLASVLISVFSAFSQKSSLELTFTAVDSHTYVQLDEIKVINRTQETDTSIFWPDTSVTVEINQGDLLLYVGYATIYPVGVNEITRKEREFTLSQNYPNPVTDQGKFSVSIPEKGTLNIMVFDLMGRRVLNDELQLDEGYHAFSFTPGNEGHFILTATWKGSTRHIKIAVTGDISGKRWGVVHMGYVNGEPVLKVSSDVMDFEKESGILDRPETNETYTFQFATNITCPGTPSVTYEGQVYNTIQIFSQCWLKENLNIGIMIPGILNQSNNGIIEKYCYDNDPDSCTKYGGLYQWNELMQYTTQEGTQGICPPGWHIPTDEEWKVLEGAVDTYYGIGHYTWDNTGYRGLNAGKNLKSTNGWPQGSNGTDLFDFSALPGGLVNPGGNFTFIFNSTFFSTSSMITGTQVWNRILDDMKNTIYRFEGGQPVAISLRCLKDEY
ncbi:FISUMP domain-containing protein [Bacteroidota bacterium]